MLDWMIDLLKLSKMRRRNFIKYSGATGALISSGALTLSSCYASSTKHITILHTNDVHSHIEPFAVNHPNYPGLGGVARRASLIEQIRKENPNTLLFRIRKSRIRCLEFKSQ